jgi:hypothetical protein
MAMLLARCSRPITLAQNASAYLGGGESGLPSRTLSGSKSTSEEARRFLEQLFLSCGGVLQTIRIVDVDQALPELDGSLVL